MNKDECRGSVTRRHDEGSRRDGRCTWCEVKFESPAPRPERFPESNLGEMWRYYKDPDFGGGKDD